jgi:SAM-dependent methyltransferase
MGSATIQGKLWGARSKDWAQLQEQSVLPLFGAVLDAARVTRGTQLLDAGCGAGLASLLAALRGAEVSAIDASFALIDVARNRLPSVDIQVADLEELPYGDSSFDAAIAVNSLFYAADPQRALSEVVRVVRPGGRVVVTSWGPAERCQNAAVIRRLGELMPPPPPGAAPGGPFAYAEPGALEDMLASAGLEFAERGEAPCVFFYPDQEIAKLGQCSSGVAQRAIEHSGESAVLAAIENADRAYTYPDGSIRYDNVFIWVSGSRQ